jgi:hypothetical protein
MERTRMTWNGTEPVVALPVTIVPMPETKNSFYP